MKEIHNNDLKQQLMSESAFKDCFLTDVSADTRLFHFLARDYIVQEGQQPSWLFYLTRGRARLYATLANGRVSLIDFFAAPCFIGEIELIDKDHEPRAVQAIEECWCLALPMKHYRPLLLNDTLFLRKLCVTLSHKNYRNIVSLTQNQSFPLVNRLAAFILLSAEYLGVSYRHLLYVLAQFIHDGLLIKSKKGYLIKNRKQLSGLALEMDPENKFSGMMQ